MFGTRTRTLAVARSLRRQPPVLRRGDTRSVLRASRPHNLHGGPPRAHGAAYCAPRGWVHGTHGPAFFEPVARSTHSADFLRRGFIIAKDIPALLKRHPLAMCVAIATVKTSLADGIVQTVAEGRRFSEIDWHRTAVFGAFGCGYLGFALYAMKVKGFQRLFPSLEAFCNLSYRAKLRDRAGLRVLASQVALDLAVLNPLIYWPTFYCFQSLCFRRGQDDRPIHTVLQEALAGYSATAVDDNLGMAKFWLPINLLVYSAPLYLRMPINHLASLVWCCILSHSQGKSMETPKRETADENSATHPKPQVAFGADESVSTGACTGTGDATAPSALHELLWVSEPGLTASVAAVSSFAPPWPHLQGVSTGEWL